MVAILTGYFERIMEPEVDDMIRDLRTLLNANDSVHSFNINDDMEYQGEIDEPAGIIGGRIAICVDTDDVRDVADEVFSTFWAYQSTASVQCDI